MRELTPNSLQVEPTNQDEQFVVYIYKSKINTFVILMTFCDFGLVSSDKNTSSKNRQQNRSLDNNFECVNDLRERLKKHLYISFFLLFDTYM